MGSLLSKVQSKQKIFNFVIVTFASKGVFY